MNPNIDPAALEIAHRYPCSHATAKYVLNLARELDEEKSQKITKDVLNYAHATNSDAALCMLHQLVDDKQKASLRRAATTNETLTDDERRMIGVTR